MRKKLILVTGVLMSVCQIQTRAFVPSLKGNVNVDPVVATTDIYPQGTEFQLVPQSNILSKRPAVVDEAIVEVENIEKSKELQERAQKESSVMPADKLPKRAAITTKPTDTKIAPAQVPQPQLTPFERRELFIKKEREAHLKRFERRKRCRRKVRLFRCPVDRCRIVQLDAAGKPIKLSKKVVAQKSEKLPVKAVEAQQAATVPVSSENVSFHHALEPMNNGGAL